MSLQRVGEPGVGMLPLASPVLRSNILSDVAVAPGILIPAAEKSSEHT